MATEISSLPRRATHPPARRGSGTWARAAAPLRSAATLSLVGAAGLLMVSAALHAQLWSTGYRVIPTVGPLFLAQAIATPVIALFLIITRWLVAVVVALATMAGTVGGFVLADTVGLFGFHDGFAAPYAGVAFVTEVAAVVLLAAGMLLIVLGKRHTRTRPSPSRHVQETLGAGPNSPTSDEGVTVTWAPGSGLPPRP